MKDNENYKSSVQTVNVPSSRGSDIGLSLLSLAVSLCSLAVSCVTLYAVMKLIQLVAPLLTPAA